MNLLRAFLVVWFVLQFLLPLLPTWGLFLPHDHIARGRVTPRDWRVHGENHRNPRSQGARSIETKILSVAVDNDLVSVFADSSGFVSKDAGYCLIPENFCARVAGRSFFAYSLAIPPSEPPPNT